MKHSRLQSSTKRSPKRSSGRQLKPVGKQLLHELRPYRGVTFYKRTGRWEANLWYESMQHYLGASSTALEAAKAYDKAILLTRSKEEQFQLNFEPSDYTEDVREMRGMSFLACRKHLRRTSRHANCHVVNSLYKGILIDQNGKWEVKYCLKNQKRRKYVLVGWYDTEDTALRAYNETALRYDGPGAMIKSFRGRPPQDTIQDTTDRIDMEVISNLERGEENVISDDDNSTCNPGFQEQLSEKGPSRRCDPQAGMQLNERRGEYHTDKLDYSIVQPYHGQNGGVVYQSHNSTPVDSPHCASSLNGGVVTTDTGAVNLSHLKTNPPFHINLSLSLNELRI